MNKEDLMFWTDILSDHAFFQINAFSPKEEKHINIAKQFYTIFKTANHHVSKEGINIDLDSLENQVKNFISFKKNIVYELLNRNILINFSPSFINHMINEAKEFESLFHYDSPKDTKNPPVYIKHWILDASGHASTIMGSLDAAETSYINSAEFYKIKFDKLHKKVSEMEMIHDNLKSQMDYDHLINEIIVSLDKFITLCENLGKLLDRCKIMSMGTFSPMVTSHFVKEHIYFIDKLRTFIP